MDLIDDTVERPLSTRVVATLPASFADQPIPLMWRIGDDHESGGVTFPAVNANRGLDRVAWKRCVGIEPPLSHRALPNLNRR